MKSFRMSKGCTEHYTSLEELRTAWNLKPLKKRTDDEEKLKAQRERFVGTCRVCHQPLTWISGTSVCACKNPDCKGVRMSSIDEEGEEKVWYIPVSRILDSKGMEIAENLFSE